MPKKLPWEAFIYYLPPDDDSIKRWSFNLGGMRYIGHANNVVPPAGMHGTRWSRQRSGILPHANNLKKLPLKDIMEELQPFYLRHIKGVRFPIRVKPAPKTHVKYVSGLVEAAKAKLMRKNLLQGICKHGAVFPFRIAPAAAPKKALPPCFVEDIPTVQALHFDYQVDGPGDDW